MRLLLVACVFLFSFIEAAAENISWAAATTISTLGVNATTPQVAINQTGSVGVAVWVEGNNIKASVYNGTSWGASSTISTGTTNILPQVVIDATGNAVVAWINSSLAVAYATRPAAGPFSGVSTISGSANAISLRLAIDIITGNSVAVWGDNSGGVIQGNIHASIYTGTWGAAVQISSDNISQTPSVAFYNQEAVAVWMENNTTYAYVADEGDGSVDQIYTPTYQVFLAFTENSPYQVAFSPDGSTGYFTDQGTNDVYVFNPATNTVTDTIGVGFFPQGIAMNPNGEFVYEGDSDGVKVISTATNTITATVTIGDGGFLIGVTPDGKFAYVSTFGTDIQVIDLTTNTLVPTSLSGNTPATVAVSPNGNTVYVANQGDVTVNVISTATNTVTGTITVGNAPYGVAFAPNGTYAYVTNSSDNNVSVINTATNLATGTISVGNTPAGVAFTPDGNFAFVCNVNDSTVSVINTNTSMVVATPAVGSTPINVAMQPANYGIYANTYSGGSWLDPLQISNTNVNNVNPTVAVPINGVALWYSYPLADTLSAPTNVQAVTAGQTDPVTWSSPVTLTTQSGLRNPLDLVPQIAVDQYGHVLRMWTNSFDGSTYSLLSCVGGALDSSFAVTDVFQSNLYGSQFSLGGSFLGNCYFAAMDYYINGGYTRIRSEEIDVTSYKPTWSYPTTFTAKNTNNSAPFISVFPTANGSVMNAAAVWINYNGSNTVVQVTAGKETKVQPVTNLAVAYGSTTVAGYTDLTVTLTWTASASTTANAYNIYRDSSFVTQVPATTLSYVDHNRDHSETGYYQVATVDNEFSQSTQTAIWYFVP